MFRWSWEWFTGERDMTLQTALSSSFIVTTLAGIVWLLSSLPEQSADVGSFMADIFLALLFSSPFMRGQSSHARLVFSSVIFEWLCFVLVFFCSSSLFTGWGNNYCLPSASGESERPSDRPTLFFNFFSSYLECSLIIIFKKKLSKLHHHYHHPAMEHHLVPSRYSPTCSKQSKLQQMSLEPAVSLFLKVNDLFFYFFISWKCLRNYTPSLLFKM